jgi:hypothetical protein
MNNTIQNPGSRAQNPDLDWTQLQETLVMLCLAAAQIENSMIESDGSFDEITNNSLTASARMSTIIQSLSELKKFQKENEITASCASIDQVVQYSEETLKLMNSTFVALQFYDRFIQQLTHVNASIQELGKLIGHGAKMYQPHEWLSLQNRIKLSYSTEIEREVFDKILQGASISEVIANLKNKRKESKYTESQAEDDTELF